MALFNEDNVVRTHTKEGEETRTTLWYKLPDGMDAIVSCVSEEECAEAYQKLEEAVTKYNNMDDTLTVDQEGYDTQQAELETYYGASATPEEIS